MFRIVAGKCARRPQDMNSKILTDPGQNPERTILNENLLTLPKPQPRSSATARPISDSKREVRRIAATWLHMIGG